MYEPPEVKVTESGYEPTTAGAAVKTKLVPNNVADGWVKVAAAVMTKSEASAFVVPTTAIVQTIIELTCSNTVEVTQAKVEETEG